MIRAPHSEKGRVIADSLVMAGLVPPISLRDALPCQPKRDARHKAGHDVESIVP